MASQRAADDLGKPASPWTEQAPSRLPRRCPMEQRRPPGHQPLPRNPVWLSGIRVDTGMATTRTSSCRDGTTVRLRGVAPSVLLFRGLESFLQPLPVPRHLRLYLPPDEEREQHLADPVTFELEFDCHA